MGHRLSISFGQAFVAPMPRHHRTCMSVQWPKAEDESRRGVCAMIADSPSRNAIARQAADLAVSSIMADYFSTPIDWDTKYAVRRVLYALNGWCFSQSRFVRGGSYTSAFSSIIFKRDTAYLFHAGDTRIYRVRGAECDQLTRDHVTDLGGYRYPSRALGMDANLDVEYIRFKLSPGDIFLFTTQTVSGTLSPSDYVRLIGQDASDLDLACDRLCRLASERASERGYDDETFCFQLVRVDQIESQAQAGDAIWDEALPVPSELSVGSMIDGYVVERVIRRTDKVRVYRVYDADSDRRFILKTPSPQLSRRSPYLRHFINQRDLVARLRSPFVNRIVTPPRAQHHFYYLLSYLEGEVLPDWLARHPQVSLEQRLDIARQMCKAVANLHACDVLHQRLRPESFLIDAHGQIVLVDFSACHHRVEGDTEALVMLARDVGLTPFSAPEYGLNTKVGRRSDQFSLAALIYWLLSYRWEGAEQGGTMPFDVPMESLRTEIARAQLRYRPLRDLAPSVPQTLDDALARALSPQRGMRFRRLAALMVALQPETAVATHQQHRWLRVWQGSVALLGVLLLLTLWLR